jgi:EpsI family protein
MTATVATWIPAVLLAIGAIVTTAGVETQRSMTLRADLAGTIPDSLEGRASRDVVIGAEEIAVAGPDTYLMRVFEGDSASAAPAFSLYVGFYGRQARGKTIHSPKNCLPGGGWEPLTNDRVTVATASGDVLVNRYVLQKGSNRALVLYWYQGRGRIESSEYLVKWDMLRDAALHRRSDEALVRVVVWAGEDQEAATQLAVRVAEAVIPAVGTALPPA